MEDLSQHDTDSEFAEAHKICFSENYKELKDTINEIDYLLSEQPNRIFTINDLFLEKNKDLGMKCAKLLVHQVRCLYQLLNHFHYNGDIQALLDEFSVDSGCLKLLFNQVTHHHVNDTKVPETKDNVHIYFAESDISTSIKPINCLLLVNFVDKFVVLIVNKLQSHQATCELDSCIRCALLEELNENVDLSPLLENFGSYMDKPLDNCGHVNFTKEFEENINGSQTFQDEDVVFDCEVNTVPSLHEVHSWKSFKEIVLRKHKRLRQYYADHYSDLKEEKQPVVILYSDTKGIVQVVCCSSISEAKCKANLLQDISEEPFPVVLISHTSYNFPNAVSRKRMVQKLNSSSKVGEEVTPSLLGVLQTPVGRSPFEIHMLFYLDTGADTGSVGYNYHVIKHFILTVETINNRLEPAVLCKFSTAKITDEEVQIFDVDEHPNWNAIGLAVLKNYRIYLDIKNNKVEIGKPEDVTEHETEETFQVTFKKAIVTSSFPTTNTEDLNYTNCNN